MFYSITKYKNNGVEDIFLSRSRKKMSQKEFHDAVVAYVDQIAPQESRMDSGLDTLVIIFVSEKEALDFIKANQVKQIRGSLIDGTITYDSNMYAQKMEKLNV